MRVGTFLCWLWGHKFVRGGRSPAAEGYVYGIYIPVQTNFCVRCGIERPKTGER